MSLPNYYNWLHSRRTCTAMDSDFDESKVKRTGKGQKGGGQFAKKPETKRKEDSRDNLNPLEGIFKDATSQEFANAIAACKADCSSENAWRVDANPPKHYEGAKVLVVTDAGSCIAVMQNGNMVSLCRAKGERPDIRGHHLMEEAIRRGGDRCDSYDGNWNRYIRAGLTPVSWTPWDPRFKPDDWKEGVNAPEDIVFFMLTGETTPIDMAEWKRNTPPFTGDSGYKDAEAARDKAIEDFKKTKK